MSVNDPSLLLPDDAPEKEPDEGALTVWQQRTIDGETVSDGRQKRRLAQSPEKAPWPPRLAYELALEMADPLDTFAKYGYDGEAATRLMGRADFALKVKTYREEIVAGGVSFKLKAKVQAEDLLQQSYDLATDTETPPSVRADLIKWTAAVAGLGPDPSKKGEGGATAGAEFRLNITFAGPGPAVAPTIDVTPVAKEIT